MRFMLVMGGSGGVARVSAYYQLSVRVRGGTAGIIGSRISAICPATMITTSNGTLLVATGYGPMLRMRQNEKSLSTAGVPAPKTQIVIATGVDLGYQPSMVTLTFDYTRFGRLAGSYNLATGHAITYTPQGDQSLQARQVDLQRFLGLIIPTADEQKVITITGQQAPDGRGGFYTMPYPGTVTIQPVGPQYGTHLYQYETANTGSRRNLSLLFTGTNAITDGPPRSGVFPVNWVNLKFTVTIRNQAGPVNPTGTGGAAYNGRYQAFMRYVDKDGNVSDPSPISNDIVIQNEPAVLYTNLEVPTDQRVARRQIFRNQNGNSDVFYLDIDTDDLTSTVLYSLNTDDQLKLNYAISVFDDNGVNQLYLYGQPPPDKPFIAEFCNIVYAVGFRTYSEGNVILTNGSTEIQGVGTDWPESFIGRQIILDEEVHTIVSVDVENQIIDIETGYTGADNPYAEYTVQPYYANSNLLNWSESGLPEAWPIANALQLPEDDDEITGLKVFANALWILKANSIYQFSTTIDPGRDGDYKPASKRGCINERCAVVVQNVCLMLDRTGVHVFQGYMPRYNYQANTTPDHVSVPIDDLFRFEGSWLRLNFEADTCFWHAIHNMELKIIRWFVAMEGYDYPQHALAYDYLQDKWWVEEYPIPITSSTQSLELGGVPVMGGRAGNVFIGDRGTLDLITTGSTRINVVSCYAGLNLVLDSVPPSCVGLPVAIVAGTGHGQKRMILSQTDDEIIVNYPFFPEPDETSVIQIGAINYYLMTPEYSYARLEIENPKAFTVEYRTAPNSLECYASMLIDRIANREVGVDASWGSVTSTAGDPGVYKIDLNSQSGYGRIVMDDRRERDIPQKYSIQVTMSGFSGRDKPIFSSMQIIGGSTKKEQTV